MTLGSLFVASLIVVVPLYVVSIVHPESLRPEPSDPKQFDWRFTAVVLIVFLAAPIAIVHGLCSIAIDGAFACRRSGVVWVMTANGSAAVLAIGLALDKVQGFAVLGLGAPIVLGVVSALIATCVGEVFRRRA